MYCCYYYYFVKCQCPFDECPFISTFFWQQCDIFVTFFLSVNDILYMLHLFYFKVKTMLWTKVNRWHWKILSSSGEMPLYQPTQRFLNNYSQNILKVQVFKTICSVFLSNWFLILTSLFIYSPLLMFCLFPFQTAAKQHVN